MFVNCPLVREDAFLFRAMANRHDVHVVEIGTAFAPVTVGENLVPTDLATGFDFPPLRHAPMEECVEPRDSLARGARLDVFEKRGEAPDDFTRVQIFSGSAERLEIN